MAGSGPSVYCWFSVCDLGGGLRRVVGHDAHARPAMHTQGPRCTRKAGGAHTMHTQGRRLAGELPVEPAVEVAVKDVTDL